MVVTQEKRHLVQPVPNSAHPCVLPPPARGKISAALQFVIPEIELEKTEKKNLAKLVPKCGAEIHDFTLTPFSNGGTEASGTFFTFAFYVKQSFNDNKNKKLVRSLSRRLVTCFLGLLSFYVGTKLTAVNIRYTTNDNRKKRYSKLMPVDSRDSMPKLSLRLPSEINKAIKPNDNVFSALFWLRRGLAERDVIKNFSALMISLQIMARRLDQKQPGRQSYPSRGAGTEPPVPDLTSLMRELVVSKLGASPGLFERLWKARHAAVAHGDRPPTPEAFIELNELKFEAAVLAFQSIRLGLGIPKDSPPSTGQAPALTDAFTYID
ncbi:MAG: hypothetical protein PVJ61_06100 [Dehalococcoidia bacterium]|jgi:hypothetical protein